MSRQSHKIEERSVFEKFRKAYDLPDGEPEFTDRPDVILRGAKTIGVEIALLHVGNGADPTGPQVQHARRQQVLEQAQKVHRASGGKQTDLWVDFNPEYPIKKVQPLAQKLARIRTKLDDLPSGKVDRTLFEHVPELSDLYHNAKEYADAKWRLLRCVDVPPLNLENLRALVSKKSKKLRDYQRCDVYWLLVVVDTMNPTQDQDFQWPAGEVLETSTFDRILLYNHPFGEVILAPQG